MDGIGAGQLGDADDFLDREIAFDRSEVAGEMRAAADLVALVRLEAVQRQLVLLRPDRHGFDAELVGGAKHADGNFGTVGDKDFRDGQGGLRSLSLGQSRNGLTRKCCSAN